MGNSDARVSNRAGLPRLLRTIRGAVGCGVCETGRVWQLGSMSAERDAERDGDVRGGVFAEVCRALREA